MNSTFSNTNFQIGEIVTFLCLLIIFIVGYGVSNQAIMAPYREITGVNIGQIWNAAYEYQGNRTYVFTTYYDVNTPSTNNFGFSKKIWNLPVSIFQINIKTLNGVARFSDYLKPQYFFILTSHIC